MTEAVTALLSGLDDQQTNRLLQAVTTITSEAQRRWGVAPTIEECISTAMAKEATYGGEFDVENALWQISKEAPTVIRAIAAAGEAEVKETENFKDSGVVSAADLENLPSHLRRWAKEGFTAEDIGEIKSTTIRVGLIRALGEPHKVPQADAVAGLREQARIDRLEAEQQAAAAKEKARGEDYAPVNGSSGLKTPRHAEPPHEYFDAAVRRMNEARKGGAT